jgi:hypothetical protein
MPIFDKNRIVVINHRSKARVPHSTFVDDNRVGRIYIYIWFVNLYMEDKIKFVTIYRYVHRYKSIFI